MAYSYTASSSSPIPHFLRRGFRRSLRLPPRRPSSSHSSRSSSTLQVFRFSSGASRPDRRRASIRIAAAHYEDFGDSSLVHDDRDDANGAALYSSDSEGSDGEVLLNPTGEVELPMTSKGHFEATDGAITVAAHRFATIEKGHRKRRTQQGLMNNVGLVAFLAMLLLFVDWCSWRIVRLPLDSFYLTRPFLKSAVLSAFAGSFFAPIADSMKIHHFRRRGKSISPSLRKPTPTMGGLFFVPIGILVARREAGHRVNGAAWITITFALIGFLYDISKLIMKQSCRIPRWTIFLIQIVAGVYFSLWLSSASISTPYSMKFLVPLPPPIGLVCMGRVYLVLAALCSVSMGTGVTLVDGLDGLAGGVAALAFIGLSVASLPICPELAIFGASMSGACIGFLFHNRYRASIIMGGIGSFALGGALTTIASLSGMFLPMFLACGIFFCELLSVLLQVSFLMAIKHLHGTTRNPLRILPSHYYLRLWGLKEPYIVAGAYIMSCFLAVLAGSKNPQQPPIYTTYAVGWLLVGPAMNWERASPAAIVLLVLRLGG